MADLLKTNSNNSIPGISRRKFGKLSAKAASVAFGFQFIPSAVWGSLTKPTLVAIGSGGKGQSDIRGCVDAGFSLIGLVDVVNAKKLTSEAVKHRKLASVLEVRESYPAAQFWTDYREMISEMKGKVDAVTVSTPDHHHFHASTLAMRAGMHVYCQKPLTHGIWESRMLSKLADETGVQTQMGNQAHAQDHMRRCVELIRAGIIGKVREVHVWTNRPIWAQGFNTLPARENVPEWLDWNQWTGPAAGLDYNRVIAPFSWRGWWEYGTGALGDMACHIMDMPYWALMPGAPKNVAAQQSGATEFSPPINSKIVWEFEPNEYTHSRGVRFNWYDGYLNAHFDPKTWTLVKESEEYNHPSSEVLDGRPFDRYGCVVIGENGKMFFNRGRNTWVINPSSTLDGFIWPAKSIPRATNEENYDEWYDAVVGNITKCQSNFTHAGPFTETILLGVIAQRTPGEKLVWDSEKMEIEGKPELNGLIHRKYSKGWEIEVS